MVMMMMIIIIIISSFKITANNNVWIRPGFHTECHSREVSIPASYSGASYSDRDNDTFYTDVGFPWFFSALREMRE
jgi:hypothetical protein